MFQIKVVEGIKIFYVLYLLPQNLAVYEIM